MGGSCSWKGEGLPTAVSQCSWEIPRTSFLPKFVAPVASELPLVSPPVKQKVLRVLLAPWAPSTASHLSSAHPVPAAEAELLAMPLWMQTVPV